MAKHNATAIPCPQCACGELVREAGFASPSSPAITRCPCHTGGVEDVKQALKDFGYDDDVVDKIYSSKAKRAFSSAAALLKSMQNENLRGNIKALLQAAGMEDFDVGLLEQSLLAEVEKHPVSEPAAKKPRQDDVPVGGGGGGGPAAAVRPDLCSSRSNTQRRCSSRSALRRCWTEPRLRIPKYVRPRMLPSSLRFAMRRLMLVCLELPTFLTGKKNFWDGNVSKAKKFMLSSDKTHSGPMTPDLEISMALPLWKIKNGKEANDTASRIPMMTEDFKNKLVTPTASYPRKKTRAIRIWWTHEGQASLLLLVL